MIIPPKRSNVLKKYWEKKYVKWFFGVGTHTHTAPSFVMYGSSRV